MRNIPEHAEIAFAGVLSRTWQWQQEMFDGSFATFEAIERESTVQIFAIQDDKILVTYQQQPYREGWYWDFLGGRVPFGVDMLEQGKHELREEAGMVATEWELLWDWQKSGYIKWNVHTYIARGLEVVGEQQLDPGGEIIEVKALDFDVFIDMILAKELGNVYIRAQVLEMKLEGSLEDFRKQLFGDVA